MSDVKQFDIIGKVVNIKDNTSRISINDMSKEITKIDNDINNLNLNIESSTTRISKIEKITKNFLDFTNVIILGDSYTSGFVTGSSDVIPSWANLLLSSLTHVNSSIIARAGVGYAHRSGTSNQTALEMWSTQKNKISWGYKNATIILCMFGYNDRDMSISQVRTACSAFYQTLKKDCPNATIISMFNPNFGFMDLNLIKTIEKECLKLNVLWWSIDTAMIGQLDYFQSDHIHPNQIGHSIIRSIVLCFISGGKYENNWELEDLNNSLGYDIKVIGKDSTMTIYVKGTKDADRAIQCYIPPSGLFNGDPIWTSQPFYYKNSKICLATWGGTTTPTLFLVEPTTESGYTSDTVEFSVTFDGYSVFGTKKPV